METSLLAWRVEELDPTHDRSSFSCGQESLDRYIKQFASQNQRTGVSKTFVALKPGEQVVRGYFSLAAGSVRVEQLTEAQRKGLPKYPIPVAHLGRLAVCRSAQGCRLGEFLLMDALRRVSQTAEKIGIHAIEVIAIDVSAKSFYEKYGFVRLQEDPHHLYKPMATVRALKFE